MFAWQFERNAQKVCIPNDYIKYELPTNEGATNVVIGVDIKDIPKVDENDFSITLNAYFIVEWSDKRLEIMLRNRTSKQQPSKSHQYDIKLTVVYDILKRLWLPDVEITNLKKFETQQVLSKLESIWVDNDHNILYAIDARITFICPMKFNAFPMDIQRCKFLVNR